MLRLLPFIKESHSKCSIACCVIRSPTITAHHWVLLQTFIVIVWMCGLIGAAFGRFKHIMWTSHRQKLGEMRGKASNVDWAAREGAKEFRRLGKHAAPSLLCWDARQRRLCDSCSVSGR